MDQTPAPFEYLSGWKYKRKGGKTVWAKAEKREWDEHQATIRITILANGRMLQPWIYLKGLGGAPEAETRQYDNRVRVFWNPKAYANEDTILQRIEEQLVPEISPEGEPALVALDAAAFHRTGKVLGLLRSCNTTPSLIPGGCTSLIQVLDVSANRLFKDILWEPTDHQLLELSKAKGKKVLELVCAPQPDAAERNTKQIDGGYFCYRSSTYYLTKAVSDAWERMQEEHCRNIT